MPITGYGRGGRREGEGREKGERREVEGGRGEKDWLELQKYPCHHHFGGFC
jgi:hypothetical protein